MSMYENQGYVPAPAPEKTPAMNIWKSVLFSPAIETFARFREQADLTRAAIWVALSGLVSGIATAITMATSGGVAANMEQLRDILPPELASELPETAVQAAPTIGSALCSIPSGAVGAVIGFFISVGLIHLVAKLLQGQGTYTETFFLSAAAAVPITIVMSVIQIIGGLFNLIPVIGPIFAILVGLVSFVLGIYSLVLSAMAVAAAHRFSLGKGFAAVLIPGAVALLFCCCITGILVAAMGAAAPNIEELLEEMSALLTLVA
ncbi:MAG: Yip1 family protein [Anaerolineae bacterium]|nr:Yip1 family protein [Anaerolineae bacterium]